jgi:hypothetical protein
MFYMSSSGHRRYWKCKLLSALFLCVLLFDCCACVLFHYFCELSKSLACLDTRLQVLSRLVIHSTHPPHTQKTVRAAAVFFIFGFLGVSFTSLTCSKRNRSSTGREEKKHHTKSPLIFVPLGPPAGPGLKQDAPPLTSDRSPDLHTNLADERKNINTVVYFTYYFILFFILLYIWFRIVSFILSRTGTASINHNGSVSDFIFPVVLSRHSFRNLGVLFNP